MKRIEWLMLVTVMLLSACGITPERGGAPAGSSAMVGLDASEIVKEIQQVVSLPASQARQRRASLEEATVADDRIRLVLLELFGPDPVRDPATGRARLERLLSGETVFRHDSARDVLSLVQAYERRLEASRSRAGRLTGALAEEQAAHAETLEKLEALREIEETMGGVDRPVPEQGEQNDRR